MRRFIKTILVLCCAVLLGHSSALAGGASDSSGDGSHCYGFFSLPLGKFAQVMVNDSIPQVVNDKFGEFLAK